MKIGELSERTGIPTRMLRYYEQQGLLASDRAANGYRSYDEADVERASRVRGLVQSGLSTRMTKVVLDIERQCESAAPPACSLSLAEELAAELDALEERLACLTKSRDAVARYLELTRHGDLIRRANAA
ncbi:MerR family transcriptional regulator [Microbacterium allomyrinae]|jgi:DNA-binding transcriptional MerR regulator|uniref:MerR family transcriptional regulator n=1 Tax=Microbacterium allomyrinae TaxID=2830666 RepID=A0A9X1S3Z3_9MICO|nr:MerR family transcriptional regulator [Microbacterium allomyrinae]MCC2032503.1 MerR family transcriptional regulator [Microbacterium allomyrinae]